MGIGRQAARDMIAAIKAGTAGRKQLRAQMADAMALLHDWTERLEFQARQAGADSDFAANRPAQFSTFLDALPEPPIDQTP